MKNETKRFHDRTYRVLAAACAPLLVVLTLARDALSEGTMSPAGDWTTIDDSTGQPRSVVHVWVTNDVLYGRITRLIHPLKKNPVCTKCEGALRNKPVLGMVILRGLRRDGNEWNGGTIVDPVSGKTYRVFVALEDGGRTLKVRGYVGISLLGRTQRWHRVE